MPQPRFLQIHTLSPYTAALLNRDDSGLAKRLPYGGALRTRISSQCLKRLCLPFISSGVHQERRPVRRHW